LDAPSLGRQPEQLAVGVEAPRPAGALIDRERPLVRAEQQPLVHAGAVVTEYERHRLRPVPLGRHHRHRPGRVDAGDHRPGDQVFEV
jgi:hypothetical protein